MSKQLAVATIGVATTTTGVGSQYMSSTGEAIASLNQSSTFSAETEGKALHQAFTGNTPSTFLEEGSEEESDFLVDDFSGFEVAEYFTVAEVTPPFTPALVAPQETVSEEVVTEEGVEFTETTDAE